MRPHPILASTASLSAVVALSAAVLAADTVGGYCFTYRAPSDTPEAILGAAASKLEDRMGSMGFPGVVDVSDSVGTIDVKLSPDGFDLDAATDLATDLGAKGDLRFVPVPPDCVDEAFGETPPLACLEGMAPLFDGSGVAYAAARQDRVTDGAVVDIELDDDAARIFDEFAEEHFSVRGRFAIVIDDVVVTAPTINAPHFDGMAQIAGFTTDEARALAAALLMGVLPVELSLEYVRSCEVSADLRVQRPLAELARAGSNLEGPATQAAMRLHDLGLDDFVITLDTEAGQITVTILSADPALIRPVEGVLSEAWFGDGLDLDYTDHTLDAFLAELPDQPVSVRWSTETPVWTDWQPAKGALIGDPSDLGTGASAGIDIDAVVGAYDRLVAFEARLVEVTEDPRFVGWARDEDDVLIMLFVRDGVPDVAVQELSESSVPPFVTYGASEIRAEEIDLTLAGVQRIRATLADILSEHGLDPDELSLSFDLDRPPAAFIALSDRETKASIREAVRERLGKGVVRLQFMDLQFG